MFNGIIKNTGKIKKIINKNNNCILEINSDMQFSKSEIGASISCSGTCLTIEKCKKNLASFYLSKETLNKTTFMYSKKGDVINLEKSLKYGDRISGHFVQGHIDTRALVSNVRIVGKSRVISFKIQRKYKKYITSKGSIAINGVSLTISKIINDGFQVSIIPKTIMLTNLKQLKKNQYVNVEFDVLGKYINNFIK